MEIPSWMYIGVGLIVSGMSGYIYKFVPKNGQPNNAMALFFFVGLIFLVIGIIKLILNRMDKKQHQKNLKELHSRMQQQKNPNHQSKIIHNNLNRQNQQHNHQHNIHQNSGHQHQSSNNRNFTIIRCSRCNTRNYTHSNFCHMCGNKLRH